MKLSPGTRSMRTGAISLNQENLLTIKSVIMAMQGKRISPIMQSVTMSPRMPPYRISVMAMEITTITITI